jgi:hypothetical protein
MRTESCISFLCVGVDLGSGSSVCPKHGSMVCPICGSLLIRLDYKGHKPSMLVLAKHDNFRFFIGCLRVELHNKTVDGVNYRGKVFIKPMFKDDF